MNRILWVLVAVVLVGMIVIAGANTAGLIEPSR